MYVWHSIQKESVRCAQPRSGTFYTDSAIKHPNKIGEDWIFGKELTYADIYLFPTLIRWELIYSKLFKCTEQELSSFEKIIEWRLKFFKLSNVNRTCFDNEWKKDYYKALFPLNPNQIIPVLPSLKEIMKVET